MSIKFGSKSPNWRGGKVKRRCLSCGDSFLVEPHVIIRGYGKFCSRSCTAKRIYGRKIADKFHFKCVVCNQSFTRYKSKCAKTKASVRCCSVKCRVIYTNKMVHVGKNHYKWVGYKVGYTGAHDRLYKVLGQPRKCEHCGTTKAKKFEWASLTKKFHDPNDYIRLCCSCHKKMDKAYLNFK